MALINKRQKVPIRVLYMLLPFFILWIAVAIFLQPTAVDAATENSRFSFAPPACGSPLNIISDQSASGLSQNSLPS